MSSIAITGGATGTGVFSLLAPSTSTNRTLTLPDSTGTVLNDQSNIEAQVKTATNASGSAPVYSCRAWVNFNGTGTVAIRASGNVSSITDNGAGDYTVNFTTAMPDVNFNIVGSCSGVSTGLGVFVPHRNGSNGALVAPAVTGVRMNTCSSNSTASDVDYVNFSIFR